MSTGYCNCVTLRAKVRLAIEALEEVKSLTEHSATESDSGCDVCKVIYDALIELKKEIGA